MARYPLLNIIPMTRSNLQHTLGLIEDLELMLDPEELQLYLSDCHLTTDEALIIDVICRNIEKGIRPKG